MDNQQQIIISAIVLMAIIACALAPLACTTTPQGQPPAALAVVSIMLSTANGMVAALDAQLDAVLQDPARKDEAVAAWNLTYPALVSTVDAITALYKALNVPVPAVVTSAEFKRDALAAKAKFVGVIER